MSARITSRRNARILAYRQVLRGEDPSRLVIEGPRLLAEALASRLELESVLACSSAGPLDPLLRERLEAIGTPLLEVTTEVLAAASSTHSPQGCAALARAPIFVEQDLFPPRRQPLVAVVASVQSSGNLGAIARCAEAFGASGLIALRGSARLYRSAALRGSAGSLLRLAALEGLGEEELLELCRRRDLTLVVCERGGALPLERMEAARPLAVVLGSEAHGIPAPLRAAAESSVAIHIEAPVESLGVAQAAAIVFHEIGRQRRMRPRHE